MAPGAPPVAHALFTVGHSTRAIEAFLEILRAHSIGAIADVRRFPASRRHPHFNGPRLAAALDTAGIPYRHFEALGGYREPRADSPNLGLDGALRGYADHMATPAYAAALGDLIAWSRDRRVAVMCAEADPNDCHRLLLADALRFRGHPVEHLLDAKATRPHRRHPPARLEAGRLVYEEVAPRFEGL